METEPTQMRTQTIFKKVLVILDGLDTSMAAATFAISMGRELGSSVSALYIVDTPTLDFLLQQHVLHRDERIELEKDLELSAEHYLHYIVETGLKNGIEISCSVQKGRLSQLGLQASRDMGVSAIVIGGCHSSSRHDMSMSERNLLLEECVCPIILIRQ